MFGFLGGEIWKFFQPILAAAVGQWAGKTKKKSVGFEGNQGAEIRVWVSSRKIKLGAVFGALSGLPGLCVGAVKWAALPSLEGGRTKQIFVP